VAKLGRKGGAVVIAAPMSTKRPFIAAIRQIAAPAETKGKPIGFVHPKEKEQ
jgi:hypothetical protein